MNEQTGLVPAQPTAAISFGQTNLRPQDFIPPRVKVVQQMAKEAANERANPGDFYNTLTGENYGPEFRIQPIQTFMQRIFLVRQERRDKADAQLLGANLPQLSDGDGLKCRSIDMYEGRGEPGVLCDTCPLSQWSVGPRGNVPPLCTETYNVAAQNEIGELVIVSFSKSSAKVGKRFFSALRFVPGTPWTKFFDLATHRETNDQGNFFVPDFQISRDRPDSAQLEQGARWAELLGQVGPIDVTPDEDLDAARHDDADASALDEPGEDLPF